MDASEKSIGVKMVFSPMTVGWSVGRGSVGIAPELAGAEEPDVGGDVSGASFMVGSAIIPSTHSVCGTGLR